MPFLLSWHFLISNHTLRARKQESLTFHTALYLFWEDNKDCLLNKYLIRLIIHSNMLYRAIAWCLRQSERTTYFFVNRPFKNPSGQMISSNNKASKVSSLMHVSRSMYAYHTCVFILLQDGMLLHMMYLPTSHDTLLHFCGRARLHHPHFCGRARLHHPHFCGQQTIAANHQRIKDNKWIYQNRRH